MLGQLEAVQSDFSLKEAELKHLTLQLELVTKKNTEHANELQEQISALKVRTMVFTSNKRISFPPEGLKGIQKCD